MTTPEMIRAIETRITRRETISLDEYGARKAVRLMEQDAELFRSALQALAHLPAGSEAVKPLEPVAYHVTKPGEMSDYLSFFHLTAGDIADGYQERALVYATPPSTPPAANVQEGLDWLSSELEDVVRQTKAAGYVDEAVSADWLRERIGVLRSKQAPTVAVPDEEALTVEGMFPNVDSWGALEWFNRLVDAVEKRNAAVRNKEDLHFELYNNIASSSASRLANDYAEAVRSALRARAEQRETPSAVVGECATDGCDNPATVHFERGGIGSSYCADCYLKVQAIPFNRAAASTSDGR
jgi:hypothetical protein